MTKFTSDTLPSLLKALEKAAEDDEMDEKKRETLHGHVEHIRELIPAMKQMLTDTEKAIKAAKL
jgi:hypothetical protein